MQSTKTLENKLNQIESYLSNHNLKNTKVSKVTVGWQLDHSLKVINAVVTTMQNSDPKLYKDNFSFLGKVLLKLNYFPKGKARAPKHIMPPETVSKAAIISQLALAKEHIKQIESLDENVFFKHPMFGNINKKRVVPFLNTHTNHHLKIVKSILK